MARKSRVNTVAVKIDSVIWKIAIYIRLSREDGKELSESESITNQRKIILDFIQERFEGKNHSVVDCYIDDGRSGTTDEEREDFQRLVRDIKAGKVNCIVCKTLSRAFRNYADQGKFLEEFLPTYNCRFIAISNPFVDTFAEPERMQDLEIPINGLMNDRYAARTSADIRRTFHIKRKNGEFIGAFAPYGYLKDPENKNRLIVDEKAAEVVRNIFSLYLDGMSKNAIVHSLNDHGIPCPSLYKRGQLGLKYQHPHADPAKKPLWCAMTIHHILSNQTYCGDMVQGRQRIVSYKVHKTEQVPKSEWYIVENTHEPIIDRETFAKTQRLLQRDTRTAPGKRQVYLFSGLLRCADCGKSMSRSKVKNCIYYYCRTYKDRSKKACTKHTIRHDQLEKAVLQAIQQQVYLAVDYEETIRQIDQTPIIKSQSNKLKEMIERKNRELSKITRYKQALYQDWKDGEISYEDYQAMKADYYQQTEALNETLAKLQTELQELENGLNTEAPFLAAFRRFQNIETLTRDVLLELVDHIDIYEGGKISIVFRFSDSFQKIQEYLSSSVNHQAV